MCNCSACSDMFSLQLPKRNFANKRNVRCAYLGVFERPDGLCGDSPGEDDIAMVGDEVGEPLREVGSESE
jgi:hypothetical protein